MTFITRETFRGSADHGPFAAHTEVGSAERPEGSLRLRVCHLLNAYKDKRMAESVASPILAPSKKKYVAHALSIAPDRERKKDHSTGASKRESLIDVDSPPGKKTNKQENVLTHRKQYFFLKLVSKTSRTTEEQSPATKTFSLFSVSCFDFTSRSLPQLLISWVYILPTAPCLECLKHQDSRRVPSTHWLFCSVVPNFLVERHSLQFTEFLLLTVDKYSMRTCSLFCADLLKNCATEAPLPGRSKTSVQDRKT